MPARIMIVNGDQTFLDAAVSALREANYEAAAFADPLLAIDALKTLQRAELLITRMQFGLGQPHGVSLGLMARQRKPSIQLLFTTSIELAGHAKDLGEVLITPVSIPDLVAAVDRLLRPGGSTDD